MSDRSDPSSSSAALTAAWTALATYDRGSGRGALQAIDDAVSAAVRDDGLRADLEPRLRDVLSSPASAVAKEYACSKLALIGGAASVTALAALLLDQALFHCAINALQVMSVPEAGAALRESVPKLTGLPLVGVLAALGHRRDEASVPVIAPLLAHTDPAVVSAALAALGEIGTSAAADRLRAFLPTAASDAKATAADSALACAERLKRAGNAAAVTSLIEALLATRPPEQVQQAAGRLTR